MTTTTEATKQLLSGSTNGRNIKVVQTATAGTLIHTATNTSGVKDRVTLYACNTSASAVKLTLELGGVSSPDDLCEVTIPSESGWVEVLPGISFNGGVVIRAFAASANVINITGEVDRLTEA
jgi:hypothetical protein